MFGGMNPSKIQGMMKKMGISQTPLRVDRVIFERAEGNLVIENPDVLKVMMQGQETYQVTGEAVEMEEEETESFTEEDVLIVSQKSGKSEEEARFALQESGGDIAEAIMSLKN